MGSTSRTTWIVAATGPRHEQRGSPHSARATKTLDGGGAHELPSQGQAWIAQSAAVDGGDQIPRPAPPAVVVFEELEQLDEIVERGPDWREIENIVVTLNCWAPYEELKGALRRRGEPRP